MQRFIAAVALAAGLATASPARPDDAARSLAVSPLVGAWIPIGDGRRDFRSAPLSGVQVVADLDPHLALVAAFAWAPTGARRLAAADLDFFQYDVGLRLQQPFSIGRGAALRPFVGVGEGLRSLRFRGAQYTGGTDFGSYASAGVEAGYRALAAGFTVRYQMTRMAVPVLGRFYQDVEVFASAGLRF